MQGGRGGRDDFFGFGGFPSGFGGFGGFGRPESLISSFFGGANPFDDPFFTRPFGSMMGHDLFGAGGSIFGTTNRATHGGFLEHENLPPKRSGGPIIKELTSDDEEEEGEQKTDFEKKVNPRKHLRPDKNPYVEEPDDDVEGRKKKQLHNINEFNRSNAKHQQNGSYFFQSSTVSYGGPSGTYYTSSTTRRAGGDGVVMEENKEADLSTRKASHRISKGIHGKGHSVTRNLNSDGRVDTVQTLHNLNEDELVNFEEDWNGKARQYLPEWSSAFANDNMRIYERDRQKLEPSHRLALPSIPQAPMAPRQSSWPNVGGGEEGQSSRKMTSPSPALLKPLYSSGRMQSQARPNPYDRRFQ
ncbi:uncharacterized protein LOC110026431 [Phalaenopsis equestris]|uniref:uncharacterized protein LOC110026431 n=1 Tax=Phalaenopsis equestris TaxID=78828 RepID=UPI0009E33742|nr:uncharacterized protein LOC110026431 [Phalaenopsis equestris]